MHTCTNNVVLSLSRVYYHVFIVVSPYPIAVLLTAYCIICTFCSPAIPPPGYVLIHALCYFAARSGTSVLLRLVVAIGCLHTQL